MCRICIFYDRRQYIPLASLNYTFECLKPKHTLFPACDTSRVYEEGGGRVWGERRGKSHVAAGRFWRVDARAKGRRLPDGVKAHNLPLWLPDEET